MTAFLAWVVFPLALAVLTGSLAIFLDRILRTELPAALLVPTGFCAALGIIGPIYQLGLGQWFAFVPLVLLGVAGVVLGRATLRERWRDGRAALLVGGGSYALFLAPVVFAGSATFLGYNFLNDTSLHLIFIQYVAENGAVSTTLEPSSYAAATVGHVANNYPFGAHELVATFDAAIPVGPEYLYQPFLAICAGVAAIAIYAFLTEAGAPRWAAALGAPVPMLSQLLFSYQLQGGIKELALVAVLCTAAALGARLTAGRAPVGHGVLLGLAAAGAVGIYGISAGAWLAPLALAIGGFALLLGGRAPRRRVPIATLAAALVFLVLAGPLLIGGVDFVEYGRNSLTKSDEFGPLSGPLRNAQAAGIWFSGDYRSLDAASPLGRRTNIAAGMAFLLAALGLAFAIRRRLLAPLIFLASTALAWLVVTRSASPYIDAKMLAILSPAVVLFACLGISAIWQRRLRWEAAIAGIALVLALGYSDLLAYRNATVAPMERLEELATMGDKFEGQGPMLINEFEEYAKYFARKAEPVAPYEAWTPASAPLLTPALGIYAKAYPLDELQPAFIQNYPLIAVRRSPAESRPPVNYRRVWAGEYYEVWKRTGPSPIRAHLPLGTPNIPDPASAAATPPCSRLKALGGTGDLVAAERPRATIVPFANVVPGWPGDPANPLGTIASGPGELRRETGPTAAGRHRVWLRGRFSRGGELSVDGKTLKVPRDYNGPKQWVDLGTIDLDAGTHSLVYTRGPNTLAPGGYSGDLAGPAVLVPDQPTRLVEVPRGDGAQLCGRSLDWVEALR